MKNPLLLGLRKPREQRQDFGRSGMVLAQRLGGLADLALAGQKHQHISGTHAGALVDGIDAGGDEIALLVPGERAI